MIVAVDRDIRADVTEVLVRYATGIDSRDWELLRSCFTDECHLDYEGVAVWTTADEITKYMADAHVPFGHVMHRITNQTVKPVAGGRVAARSYVDAMLMNPANTGGTHIVGMYEDELVQVDGEWKIVRRHFTPVHYERVGADA